MNAVRQVAPAEARALLRAKSAPLLVDVREPWEHEIVSLPDALLIPLAQLPSRFRELPSDQALLIYCHHGIRSWHAACFLEQNGFNAVFNLSGGIDAWAIALDASMAQY